MVTRVVTIPLPISNAHLLLGDRPVLVDAGAPGDGDRLLRALRAHRVAPADLALIVLTHGHTDHTGGVGAVAAGGAPVAIGAGDAGLLRAGANGALPPTGPAGALLRPYIKRLTFAGLAPQIEITEPLRLEPYGLSGVVVPVAGHTPGSCVLFLDGDRGGGGDAVIGDLARGGFASGRIRPGHPLRHYFAEDAEGVRRGMDVVLAADPARLHVGHGGPISAEAARRRLDAIAPHRTRGARP